MTVTIELRPEVEARLQKNAVRRGLPMQEYIQQLIEFLPAEKGNSEAVSPSETTLRPFGLCAGEFIVPDDFDAPLPDDILAEFEGK